MSLPKNITQLEYTKFVPDANNDVSVRTILGNGNATIYAVVNTTAVGNTNSLATLLAGPNQIGSVTVSNPIQLAGGTNYIGLVTVGNTVNSLLQTGSSYIGLASVNVGGTLPALSTGTSWIGLATINIGSSNATLYAIVNTGAIGNTNSLATILAGPNQIGSVTVSNTVFTEGFPYSYYNQSSLVSGYVYHGFTIPGNDPTTANFKIMRETLYSGEVLFANGLATFINTWSAASLASITYL